MGAEALSKQVTGTEKTGEQGNESEGLDVESASCVCLDYHGLWK
jgi:hypothetical protein